MEKYLCSVCGYVYDESLGNPQGGITPGTKWQDVKSDWVCPLCGATKAEFKKQIEESMNSEVNVDSIINKYNKLNDFSHGQLEALFLNLSKGCEKQCRTEEAELFAKMAEYYNGKIEDPDSVTLVDFIRLLNLDIEKTFGDLNIIANEYKDRGALRSLTWSEKVSRILASLVARYEKDKEQLLSNNNIYVCEICGFVYIGKESPDICPICKVPNLKIKKIEKEAV